METKKDFWQAVVIAFLLAVGIRFFLFEPFVIPSGSMEPTLQPGDRIIVEKVSYRFREPWRGEIVVFKYPLDPDLTYVKRLIALGNERIEINGNHLYINAQRLDEPYLSPGTYTKDFGPEKVPPGHFFVMGDNRSDSCDSRFWGPFPRENLVGRAVLIFWPPHRIGFIY